MSGDHPPYNPAKGLLDREQVTYHGGTPDRIVGLDAGGEPTLMEFKMLGQEDERPHAAVRSGIPSRSAMLPFLLGALAASRGQSLPGGRREIKDYGPEGNAIMAKQRREHRAKTKQARKARKGNR